MSDQSSTDTTTNTPAESLLCKLDGNSAAVCSKRPREIQPKKENNSNSESLASETPSAPTPMDVDTQSTTPPNQQQPELDLKPTEPTTSATEAVTATVQPKVVKKKKKKKTSYKAMMASMTKRTKDEKDVVKEREEALRKVTGGGAFTKIDKI